MPIFQWFWFFQFLRLVYGGQKIWPIAPRSNEVMDTKNDSENIGQNRGELNFYGGLVKWKLWLLSISQSQTAPLKCFCFFRTASIWSWRTPTSRPSASTTYPTTPSTARTATSPRTKVCVCCVSSLGLFYLHLSSISWVIGFRGKLGYLILWLNIFLWCLFFGLRRSCMYALCFVFNS